MKAVLLSATMMIGLASAASAELYAVYPENCAYGAGGEGNIEIGTGEFSLSESVFTRVGNKVDAGNGFFTAPYAQMSEGEAIGEMDISLRIANGQVDLVLPGGQTVTARSCS